MKSTHAFTTVLIHREPVDMRRGINGLCMLVASADMGELPCGQNLFVFAGKRRDSIKVLYFDKTGFCLWQKRLEQAKFPWPKKFTESVVKLSPEQFAWLLEGYDVFKMKPFERVNFERVA